MRGVRALTFDVFGTCVDWRTGIAAAAAQVGREEGVEGDWEQLADRWRALCMPYMDRVRKGELPWTNFDRLHRMSLDQVMAEMALEGFDSAARDRLTASWERLPAWPEAAAGLERLRRRFTVSTLSNGNRSQQESLLRFAGLAFQRVQSAEDFHHYKPDPEVYRGAASALGFEPEQVMMVACHKGDLRAARAAGLRAAFVERPLEKGPGGGADHLPDPESDVQAKDFEDLATKLGC